jgi:hypothetical protein
MLTIDKLIERLTLARENSKLGGAAVVHVCLPEVPYVPVVEGLLETCGDGAVFLLTLPDDAVKINTPNVIIDVSGGNVQGVSSDFPVNYLLLDQDNIEGGDVDPDWCKATEDYKRVVVLLDDPAAEIETDATEFRLTVDVVKGGKPAVDAIVKTVPVPSLFRETKADLGDNRERLLYQFSYNFACFDARKRLQLAALPEVLAIDPD